MDVSPRTGLRCHAPDLSVALEGVREGSSPDTEPSVTLGSVRTEPKMLGPCAFIPQL